MYLDSISILVIMFVCFEGCDFSGKSTQISLLISYLKKLSIPVYSTREPGGSRFAERIRSLLLKEGKIMNPMIEYLLLAAARKDHVDNVIRKYLSYNYFVVSDRFYLSSLCYQGFYKNLDINFIKMLKLYTIGNFEPDITIILNISRDVLIKRIRKRSSKMNYDLNNIDFHCCINKYYQKIASRSNKFIIIDADKSVDSIHSDIVKRLFKK